MKDMFEKGEQLEKHSWWLHKTHTTGKCIGWHNTHTQRKSIRRKKHVLRENKQEAKKMLIDEVTEDLRAWFGKGKKGGAGGGGWDLIIAKGERIGKCGDSKKGEGKPKCPSKSRVPSPRAKGGKKAIVPSA